MFFAVCPVPYSVDKEQQCKVVKLKTLWEKPSANGLLTMQARVYYKQVLDLSLNKGMAFQISGCTSK